VSWLGHATVGIDAGDTRLLTDPLLRSRLGHLRRAVPVDRASIGPVRAVLISHVHYDHLDIPSLHLLERGFTVYAPAGAGPLLRRRGFDRVEEFAVGDLFYVEDVPVRVVPAAHQASRTPLSPRLAAVGFVVGAAPGVYFAGDTGLFAGMAELAPLDVALVPVAGWGPRLPEGHLNAEQAVQALEWLCPRVAIPIHWGTYYPLTALPPSRTALAVPALAFRSLGARHAPQVRVEVLEPGGSLTLTEDDRR